MNLRRILALVGVILLIGLYVAAFILSFMNHPDSGRFFLAAILCTIIIPVLIHLLLMMNNVRKGKNVLDEPYSYRESKGSGSESPSPDNEEEDSPDDTDEI
ncbi:MAG: hypothetical protein K5989_10040 [Lachnospiraceae bacterium]|nr:hypothetical protein [Lachnospiraceae bacterium]